MKSATCCFFAAALKAVPGISAIDDSFCSRLIIKLVLEIEQKMKSGCNTFLAKADSEPALWLAEAILDIKRVYPEKNLHLNIVRTQGHNERTSAILQNQAVYNRVLKEADSIIVLDSEYDVEADDDENCIHYMMDQSSHVIAVSDGYNAKILGAVEAACKSGLNASVIRYSSMSKKQISVQNLTILH